MPLNAAEKAALALRLCAARHLDPDCCPADDMAGLNLVEAARGQINGAADGARLHVTSGAAVGPYLTRQADGLAGLPRGGAGDIAVARVSSAESLLRLTAANVRQQGTGDGPSTHDEAGAPCACGVLDLAAKIETRIRRLMADRAGRPCGSTPAIEYVTALTDDDRDFRPFRIGGNARIGPSPRKVEMTVKAEPLTSRDLWHIAYTLHHELVCHAFQGVGASGRLPDAHATCHWSEGWMDTLTFDLVREWEEPPLDWLPLRGETAQAAIRTFHDHRYDAPLGLSTSDIKHRRYARDAYLELAKTLVRGGMAASDHQARDDVQRFSLAANAHRDANCHRLKTLGTKLRLLLLNDNRPDARFPAARACLAFSRHNDLGRLEREIDVASG